MDNYDISSIKPVDNYLISCVYETFSNHYARPIHISKLYGMASATKYGLNKNGIQTSGMASLMVLLTRRINCFLDMREASKVSV